MTRTAPTGAAGRISAGANITDVLHDARAPVIKVRPDQEMATTQRLPYFVGISAHTAGATVLESLLIKILWNETREPTHAMRLCRLCDEGPCLKAGCPVECREQGLPMPARRGT